MLILYQKGQVLIRNKAFFIYIELHFLEKT